MYTRVSRAPETEGAAKSHPLLSVQTQFVRSDFVLYHFVFPVLGSAHRTDVFVCRSARMERMATLEPLFVDVTWGAGGSTSDLTLAISANAQKYLGVEVLMHLTCTNLKVFFLIFCPG